MIPGPRKEETKNHAPLAKRGDSHRKRSRHRIGATKKSNQYFQSKCLGLRAEREKACRKKRNVLISKDGEKGILFRWEKEENAGIGQG